MKFGKITHYIDIFRVRFSTQFCILHCLVVTYVLSCQANWLFCVMIHAYRQVKTWPHELLIALAPLTVFEFSSLPLILSAFRTTCILIAEVFQYLTILLHNVPEVERTSLWKQMGPARYVYWIDGQFHHHIVAPLQSAVHREKSASTAEEAITVFPSLI